jgi:hypothetical protein
MKTFRILAVALCTAIAGFSAMTLHGQTTSPALTTQSVGGVSITPGGMLRMRRAANLGPRRAGDPSLTYVSLPRVFAELKAQSQPAAGGAGASSLSRDIRYLKGLTRIDYLFVYPEEHDLVIAGPSEPLNEINPLEPVGTLSGRPAVQVEDLIVALRAVDANGGDPRNMFGCSLDMAPDAQKIANAIGQRFGNAPRGQLAEELKKALGPQQVRILGVPADTRVAFAMVSADYHLKRMCIGIDPVPTVGNALGSGLASNRLWFEPAYEPLGVSPDGLSYHLAGPRLKVEAGPQDFVKQGATPAATAFAKRFSDKMPAVAAQVAAIADLQNLADEFMVAALIRKDGLEQKAGVDFSWIRSDAYHVASLQVPQTAETLVSDNGAMIAEGGVKLESAALAATERTGDSAKAQALRNRPDSGWFLVKKGK